ncbi:stress response protein [Proteus phage Privateer]|uniref:Stress response protein n=1 Tax=Proteus phage Privateer TaxID=2712958 RepID=A0A6G8R423_9CAUD|nr:stress response protein [Proteus phage Privateer]QIN94916.1 stress response protein [Proteus phage Privateer]
MSIVLSKNQTINMSKAAKSLTKLRFGLAWDESADLDAVLVALDDNGKIKQPDSENIAYYGNCTGNEHGNAENPVAGVVHYGDARDGAADGDDETIEIDLTKVQANKLLIAVTSYSANEPVPFAASTNPVARLYGDDDKVLFEAKLDENAAFSTAVEFVMIEKDTNGEWQVTNLAEPVGESSKNGLADILESRKA